MHKFHKSGSDKKFNLSLDIYLLIHRYFENTKMIIQDFVHDSYQQKCLYVLSFVYLLYVPRRGFFSYWLDCNCQMKCHKFRPMVLRAVLVRVIYHMLMTVKSQDLDFKSHSKDLRPLLPHALCLPKNISRLPICQMINILKWELLIFWMRLDCYDLCIGLHLQLSLNRSKIKFLKECKIIFELIFCNPEPYGDEF